MVSVLYAYDKPDGTTILRQHNNTIFLGDAMEDSLANPFQSEEIGIRSNLRPKAFYPDEEKIQSLTFADGTVIPIVYDGVLPFLPIRRPSLIEVESCERLPLSSPYDWDERGGVSSPNLVSIFLLWIHHTLSICLRNQTPSPSNCL